MLNGWKWLNSIELRLYKRTRTRSLSHSHTHTRALNTPYAYMYILNIVRHMHKIQQNKTTSKNVQQSEPPIERCWKEKVD